MSATEASSLRSQGLPILLIDSANNSNLTSTSTAVSEANVAIGQARSLGVPNGTALFRDVENRYSIDSNYVAAWHDTVAGSGYVPGFYENPLPGSSGFSGAYCAAVRGNAAVGGGTVLYSDEPEPSSGSFLRSQMPAWAPAVPPCANTTIAWQYKEGAGNPNVDVDESLPQYANYLWGGRSGSTGTSSNLLSSASFEGGQVAGWNRAAGSNWAAYSNSGAHDGQYYLEMNTGTAGRGASIWQDVALNTTAGQSFAFSAWLRSPTGTPALVCLALWGLGGTQEGGGAQQTCVTLGSVWTLMTVPLDTHVSAHSVLRAQIYLYTAGPNYDVDGATLTAPGA